MIGRERTGRAVDQDQDPVLQPGTAARGDQAVLCQGEDTRQCASLIQVVLVPVPPPQDYQYWEARFERIKIRNSAFRRVIGSGMKIFEFGLGHCCMKSCDRLKLLSKKIITAETQGFYCENLNNLLIGLSTGTGIEIL